MEIVETLLPGVGMRYDVTLREGRTLGVVVHREGGVELSTYGQVEDPDEATEVYHLQPDEAAALAELLGAPRMAQRFADLSREVPGLLSARLSVESGSRFAGRPLGETKARTRTGCSIVAIVRGDEVVTAPGPSEELRGGDVLVVIGSEGGLRQLEDLLGERP